MICVQGHIKQVSGKKMQLPVSSAIYRTQINRLVALKIHTFSEQCYVQNIHNFFKDFYLHWKGIDYYYAE